MAPDFFTRFRAKLHRRFTEKVTATKNVLYTYELLEYILTFLDTPADLRQTRLVSTYWHTVVAKNDTLDQRWRKRTFRPAGYMQEIPLLLCSGGGCDAQKLAEAWCRSFNVEGFDPTGGDNWRKQVAVDGVVYLMDVSDIRLDHYYRSMLEYQVAHICAYVLVYEPYSRSSFDAIVDLQQQMDTPGNSLYENIQNRRSGSSSNRRRSTKPWLLGVVATKCEAKVNDVEVDKSEGVDFAERLGVAFFEVSIRPYRNDNESLVQLVRQYVNYPPAKVMELRRSAARTPSAAAPSHLTSKASNYKSFWSRLRKY